MGNRRCVKLPFLLLTENWSLIQPSLPLCWSGWQLDQRAKGTLHRDLREVMTSLSALSSHQNPCPGQTSCHVESLTSLGKPKSHGEATEDKTPCGGSMEAQGLGMKKPSWKWNIQPQLPQLTPADWQMNHPRPSGPQLTMDT